MAGIKWRNVWENTTDAGTVLLSPAKNGQYLAFNHSQSFQWPFGHTINKQEDKHNTQQLEMWDAGTIRIG